VHFQFLIGHLVINTFTSDSVHEITEKKIFGILGLEVSGEIEFGELFFNQVKHKGFVGYDVFHGNQSVTVSSFAFMDPDFNEFFRVLELLGVGNQKTVENVTDVSNIEFIMEVNSGFSERLHNTSMEHQISLDYQSSIFLNLSLEVFQVSSQKGIINNKQ